MALYMIFRFLGDISHTLSKFILIWAIHCNRSAEGVSLITQILYLGVFCCRYVDWFWKYPIGELMPNEEPMKGLLWWNFILKFFYVATSAYIVLIMMRLFPRTRERERGWKLGGFSLIGSALSAPLVCLIFRGPSGMSLFEVIWTFSIELESVCVLPQLLLLRQTTVPTVIDSFYLIALGSYRALYLLNWIGHWVSNGWFDPIPELFGIVQTILYIDFAWVYFGRQRVKLRGGGIVDSEDFGRGWLVSKFLGRQVDGDEVERGATGGRADSHGPTPSQGRWGARGISVSADDTLREESQPLNRDQGGRMTDPEAFEDDLDSDAEEHTPSTSSGQQESGVVGNGAEWRDENRTT